MNYRSEIDGLRAFAVLSVVAFHYFPHSGLLRGGFVGVDIFFVISGFLITSHIFENLEKGQFSFIDFFGRRIRRIFPGLILVMACSLGFGWFVLLSDELIQLGRHAASGAAFIINFTLADEIGYFDNASYTKPMLHLWSLAIEEQFYIIWPLLLWLAWKKKINLLSLTIFFALISLYYNLFFGTSNPKENFFLPFGRLWELLVGSILAWFFVYKSSSLDRFKVYSERILLRIIWSKNILANGLTILNLMSFLGFALLVLSVLYINESLVFPSKWTLLPVLGTVLIIASGSKPWLNRFFLSNSVSVWFGRISYTLYLWHWPILSFLFIIEGEAPHRDARIIAVVASILLAWLSYQFVERPIRYGGRKTIKSLILIMLIFLIGILGLYILKSDGLTKYNQKIKYISEAKGDWNFPGKLTNQSLVKATSDRAPTVLMIGDSHIQAFGPRIVDLYSKGITKEIAFLTGCAPIPVLKGCQEYFDRINEALSLYPIDTVILGGTLHKLLNYSGKLNYAVVKDGETILLNTEKGRQLAKRSFIDFVDQLNKKYQTIVVSHAAAHPNFSPSNILRKDGKRGIPLGTKVYNSPFIIDTSFEMEVKQWLKPIGVPYVSQSAKVCPDNLCTPLTTDGKPKYKDVSHMRPFYVIEYMDILDAYILLN